MIDESVDIKGRKVLNVLVGPLERGSKMRLCVTKFLDKCDGKKMAQEVIATLNILNIPLDNLVVLVTDNVNYNLTAGKKLAVVCDRYFTVQLLDIPVSVFQPFYASIWFISGSCTQRAGVT